MRRESSVRDILTALKIVQEQKWLEEKECEFRNAVYILAQLFAIRE
jgi:hypothetical protein